MKTSKHTQNKHTQMACMHTECPTMPVIHPTNFHGTSHEPIRLCYFCFKNFEYYECPTDSNYVLIHITSPTSYRGWTLRLVFFQNCDISFTCILQEFLNWKWCERKRVEPCYCPQKNNVPCVENEGPQICVKENKVSFFLMHTIIVFIKFQKHMCMHVQELQLLIFPPANYVNECQKFLPHHRSWPISLRKTLILLILRN